MTSHGLLESRTEVRRVAGREIRVRVDGEGDGDPLVLLNGLARPLESWEPLTQELSGRTVISFDAPGVGASPTPLLPMSIPTLAELATSVLQGMGFKRADFLGFSYGGAVAQQLTIAAPQSVRRLLLVSTSCGVGATPGSYDALRGCCEPSDPNTGSWQQPDPLGTLWQYLAISGWSSIPFLGAIRTPTLVVCGDRDTVVPPVNSTLLARRIPGARLVRVDAGHDLQPPGPAGLLARAVETFLA